MSAQRPTLPAFHTLNLPDPSKLRSNGQPNSAQSSLRPSTVRSHGCQSLVWPSVSSETSPYLPIPSTPELTDNEDGSDSDSDYPPPTPVLSIAPLSPDPRTQSTPTHVPPFRFRLEPCPLHEAQAVVVVTEPIPSQEQTRGQAVLLVGPAMEQYRRQPERALAKGSRVQPYRIVPSRRK